MKKNVVVAQVGSFYSCFPTEIPGPQEAQNADEGEKTERAARLPGKFSRSLQGKGICLRGLIWIDHWRIGCNCGVLDKGVLLRFCICFKCQCWFLNVVSKN